MPRLARRIFAGLPHHVVQRGNRRDAVFFQDADRTTYLDWLREHCADSGVQVLAYCLMTNHVHLVAVPTTADGLTRALRPLHTRYAMRVNRRRGSTGHTWQGRFFSSTLDEPYLWAAIRYVERNPVRAGMIGEAWAFRWSSAAAHCGLAQDPVLTRDPHWLETMRSVNGCRDWLSEAGPPAQVAELRQRLRRSLPCGSEQFVRGLEQRCGVELSFRPRGRPRKSPEPTVRAEG